MLCTLVISITCSHILGMLNMYSMYNMFKHEHHFPVILYLYPSIDYTKKIYLKISIKWLIKYLSYNTNLSLVPLYMYKRMILTPNKRSLFGHMFT